MVGEQESRGEVVVGVWEGGDIIVKTSLVGGVVAEEVEPTFPSPQLRQQCPSVRRK